MKWHVDGQFDADVNVDIRDENDFPICEIGLFEDDWTPEEIQRANLIAAAPDLLEALLSHFNGTCYCTFPNGKYTDHGRHCELTRAALAKASGTAHETDAAQSASRDANKKDQPK